MPQYGVLFANSNNDVINSLCIFSISSLSFFDKFVHVSMPYVTDGIITVSKRQKLVAVVVATLEFSDGSNDMRKVKLSCTSCSESFHGEN